MDPKDYDPPGSLSFLELINSSFNFFREANSFEDFVHRIGPQNLADVTELPEFKLMEVADPLPPGFLQRVYQFLDPNLGRGVIDIAFHNDELVNLRSQLFFKGWFAKKKARKYLRNVLIPSYQEMFGEPAEKGTDYSTFISSGLQGVARYVPGTISLSAYLTDERYL